MPNSLPADPGFDPATVPPFPVLTLHLDEAAETVTLDGAPVERAPGQELRDAGAEVIEINDSIRLVASSSITGSTGAVQVDGHDIGPDIVIEVIGDPATLEQGARFRGGLVSEIESEAVGGRVTIDQVQLLEIRSVVEPRPQVYASPGP